MALRTPAGHGLGRLPDLGDIRDYPTFITPLMEPLPPVPAVIDLRGKLPPVGNQGMLGSCTAWMAKKMYEALLYRQGLTSFDGSALAHYYWTRELEGTPLFDSGASIRDAVKVLAKKGLAPESAWPYDINKFTKRPVKAAEREALKHQAIQYTRVPPHPLLMRRLLADGYPIGIGISVYESFETPEVERTGTIPFPDASERLLGGHAVYLVGYDHRTQWFIFGNHWGEEWGDHGYGYLSYDYVMNPDLASDFWVVRQVEG
jgi:hypothetical protein